MMTKKLRGGSKTDSISINSCNVLVAWLEAITLDGIQTERLG
jgi:hypothetical protein